jgi:hypothetical protein
MDWPRPEFRIFSKILKPEEVLIQALSYPYISKK